MPLTDDRKNSFIASDNALQELYKTDLVRRSYRSALRSLLVAITVM
jgi:hypothetical protein